MTFSTVLNDSWVFFRRHYQMLLLLYLPSALISLALNHWVEITPEQLTQMDIPRSTWFWLLASLIVSLWCQIALIRFVADRVQGRAVLGLGQYFATALAVLPIMIISLMLMSGLIGLGLMLFVLPGLYLFFRLWFVLPVIALEPSNPVAAIGRSWRLTAGCGGLFLVVWLAAIGYLIATSFLVAVVELLGVDLLVNLVNIGFSALFAILYLLVTLRLYDHQISE